MSARSKAATVLACGLLVAACSDDPPGSTATPSATETALPTESGQATATGSPTAAPGSGSASPTGSPSGTVTGSPSPLPSVSLVPVLGTIQVVRDWSTDKLVIDHPMKGGTQLVAVRASRYSDAVESFNRLELVFDYGLPGYIISYGRVFTPTWDRVTLDGPADLGIELSPAMALGVPNQLPESQLNGGGLPVLLEYRYLGELHRAVHFGVGLSRKTDFRVIESTNPYRIAIDFKA